MMKRFLFILLVLCLLIPCAALAADGDLPDVEAFSDGLLKLEPEHEEKLDYKIAKFYRGTDEDVLAVAEAYGALLLDRYGMDEICRFPAPDPEDDVVRVYWAFEYTKSEPSMGSNNIWNDGEGWKIDGYQVLIEYSQSDYYSGEYVMIHYRPEFNYIDTGDRINGNSYIADDPAPAVLITGAPMVTAKPAGDKGEKCSNCGGDGEVSYSCSSCGGDGQTSQRCASCGGDGERDCMSCSGKGYDNCSGCYGSGDRRCGRCNGTGKDGKGRCSNCGGDGEVKCSSCSGSGKKRCSACSGSGDRDCSSCNGRGSKDERCSSCSGDGRRESTCSVCNGTGRV